MLTALTAQVHPAEDRFSPKRARPHTSLPSCPSPTVGQGQGGLKRPVFSCAIWTMHRYAMAEVVEMLNTRDSCLILMALFEDDLIVHLIWISFFLILNKVWLRESCSAWAD